MQIYTIQLKDLTKKFTRLFRGQALIAVERVNLKVKKGEILGILGPNGAGKSTLLKMICGLLRPTGGEIFVNGQQFEKHRSEILARIGVVLEGSRNSLWSMTVKENLTYFGYLKNVHGKVLKKRGDELLNLFRLEQKKNEPVKNLSKGMRQKLAIALSFINDPDLILLDEPTLGLDVQTARLVKNLIVDLAKENNKTVLLSTHHMEIVEEICDRVAIVNKGGLIALDDTEKLLRSVEREFYTIKLRGRPDINAVERIPTVRDVELVDYFDGEKEVLIRLAMNRENSLFEVIEALRRNGIKILSMTKSEPNLEDIFVKLVED